MPFISKSFLRLFFSESYFAPSRSGSCWTLGRNHSRAFRVGSKGFSESWFSTFHPQTSFYTRLFFWELIGIFSCSCSHWSIERIHSSMALAWTEPVWAQPLDWLARQPIPIGSSKSPTDLGIGWTYCSRNWSKPHSSTDSKLSPNGNGNPRDLFESFLVLLKV